MGSVSQNPGRGSPKLRVEVRGAVISVGAAEVYRLIEASGGAIRLTNEQIGARIGCSARGLRHWLVELEAGELIARHYTANYRELRMT